MFGFAECFMGRWGDVEDGSLISKNSIRHYTCSTSNLLAPLRNILTNDYPLFQYVYACLPANSHCQIESCFDISCSQDNIDGNALDVDKASLCIPY